MKLLIVGDNEAGDMGSYLASAARQLGLDYHIIDARAPRRAVGWSEVFTGGSVTKGRPGSSSSGGKSLETCAATKYDFVLTTGRAPLDRSHILKLRDLGASVINYSTDDP